MRLAVFIPGNVKDREGLREEMAIEGFGGNSQPICNFAEHVLLALQESMNHSPPQLEDKY